MSVERKLDNVEADTVRERRDGDLAEVKTSQSEIDVDGRVRQTEKELKVRKSRADETIVILWHGFPEGETDHCEQRVVGIVSCLSQDKRSLE